MFYYYFVLCVVGLFVCWPCLKPMCFVYILSCPRIVFCLVPCCSSVVMLLFGLYVFSFDCLFVCCCLFFVYHYHYYCAFGLVFVVGIVPVCVYHCFSFFIVCVCFASRVLMRVLLMLFIFLKCFVSSRLHFCCVCFI